MRLLTNDELTIIAYFAPHIPKIIIVVFTHDRNEPFPTAATASVGECLSSLFVAATAAEVVSRGCKGRLVVTSLALPTPPTAAAAAREATGTA